MNKVFYTNLLLKKDRPVFSARMENEGATQYPLLKNDIVETISEEKEIVNLLDKYGIISLTLSEKWNMPVVSDKLLDTFKQLEEALSLKEIAIGAGKLHIVISDDIKETAKFTQVEKEMVLSFNHPDNLNQFAKQWFHFIDNLQTVGKSLLPQSEIEDRASSVQQLISTFSQKPNEETLSYKENADMLSKKEGKPHNANSEMVARSFETYVQTQLEKDSKTSIVTNKKEQSPLLYPNLEPEQIDLWKMVINKYQKKLQADPAREIIKMRRKAMESSPQLQTQNKMYR